jgi:hypothetical protein
MNCQRYYFRFNATAAYSKFGFGWARSSARASILINFPVQMRTGPSTFDVNTASQYVFYSGADYTASAIALDQISQYTVSLNVTVSGATANQPGEFQSNGVTTSYLGFGAEL